MKKEKKTSHGPNRAYPDLSKGPWSDGLLFTFTTGGETEAQREEGARSRPHGGHPEARARTWGSQDSRAGASGQADREPEGPGTQEADRAETDGRGSSGRGGFQRPTRAGPGQCTPPPTWPTSLPSVSPVSPLCLPTSQRCPDPSHQVPHSPRPSSAHTHSTIHSAACTHQHALAPPTNKARKRGAERWGFRGSSCLCGGLPRGRSQAGNREFWAKCPAPALNYWGQCYK